MPKSLLFPSKMHGVESVSSVECNVVNASNLTDFPHKINEKGSEGIGYSQNLVVNLLYPSKKIRSIREIRRF
jgi:hypothetical protein